MLCDCAKHQRVDATVRLNPGYADRAESLVLPNNPRHTVLACPLFDCCYDFVRHLLVDASTILQCVNGFCGRLLLRIAIKTAAKQPAVDRRISIPIDQVERVSTSLLQGEITPAKWDAVIELVNLRPWWNSTARHRDGLGSCWTRASNKNNV